MPNFNLTSLSRIIDIRYKSNLFIVILCIITFAFSFMLGSIDEANLRSIISASISNTVFVFLIWAILRELDPDHSLSALIGGLCAFITSPFIENKQLLLGLLTLLIFRIIVRSVGITATIVDVLLISLLIFILSTGINFVVALIGLMLFACEYFLPKSSKFDSIVGIILSIIIFVYSLITNEKDVSIYFPNYLYILIAGFFILQLPIISKNIVQNISSKCDNGVEVFIPARIIAAYISTIPLIVFGLFVSEISTMFFVVIISLFSLYLSHLYRFAVKRIRLKL